VAGADTDATQLMELSNGTLDLRPGAAPGPTPGPDTSAALTHILGLPEGQFREQQASSMTSRG